VGRGLACRRGLPFFTYQVTDMRSGPGSPVRERRSIWSAATALPAHGQLEVFLAIASSARICSSSTIRNLANMEHTRRRQIISKTRHQKGRSIPDHYLEDYP